jgi:acetyltransferase-like isoleucine patch superfamily enzyme
MSGLKRTMKRMKYDLLYLFLNNFVCHIPSWTVRRAFYRLFGMKIGRKARIGLNTKVINPRKIEIDNRTVINENCYLDGRGGLTIAQDSSISFGTTIITGTHRANDPCFAFRSDPVIIESNVWVGAHAIILNGSILKKFAIIGAGSVIKGTAEESGIYLGNPAVMVKKRECGSKYELDFKAYFR